MMYVANELGITVCNSLVLNVDANAAMGFIRNTGGRSRMKHIDIRAAWMQLVRNTVNYELKKVSGEANEADFFTKLFGSTQFSLAEQRMMAKLPDAS